MTESDPVPEPATIAARGGRTPEFATPSSSPPLYLTTAFDLRDLGELDAVVSGQVPGYIYTRDGNPNHEAFAADVAALEGAEMGVVTASGMGALTALLLAEVRSGDHIIAGQVLYGRTGQLLNHWADAYGVRVTFVNVADLEQVRAAVTPETRLCIVETISNPLVEVTDLAGVAAAVGSVPVLVDNTFATPCLVRPVDHGATYVWHSASKYLNGHGDVMLGVLVGPRARMRKVRALTALSGVNSNPWETWLASRGLRTLPLRVERVSQTALSLAEFLTTRPQVERVYYPGLNAHPTFALARHVLKGGSGGMLAFDLRGGRSTVDLFFRKLADRVPFSPTLADTRTTLSYPAGTSHKFMTAQQRAEFGIGEGLVRLSVGLEDVRDLQRELGDALAVTGT